MTTHLSVYDVCSDTAHHSKVTREEYNEALRVSKKGKVIILKRTVKELWVNNYNPEWIRAWNGNMDVQLCLDFFAIVTYITGLATWLFFISLRFVKIIDLDGVPNK